MVLDSPNLTLLVLAHMKARQRVEQRFTFPADEVVPEPGVSIRTHFAHALIRLAVQIEPGLRSQNLAVERAP